MHNNVKALPNTLDNKIMLEAALEGSLFFMQREGPMYVTLVSTGEDEKRLET